MMPRTFPGFFILFGITALLLFGIFVFELYAIINATIHAHRGEYYTYPISISFIKKPVSADAENINQSKNDHTS